MTLDRLKGKESSWECQALPWGFLQLLWWCWPLHLSPTGHFSPLGQSSRNLGLGSSFSQIQGSIGAQTPIIHQAAAAVVLQDVEDTDSYGEVRQPSSSPVPLQQQGPCVERKWGGETSGRYGHSLLPTNAFPVPSSGKHFWPKQLLLIR